MNLQERIDLLIKLGYYLKAETPEWMAAKEKAGRENGWFIPSFIDAAISNIINHFLSAPILKAFVAAYPIPFETPEPKEIGLVMAGNIPLVGFHDWLCIFLSGHRAAIKPSTKDRVLITHLVKTMAEWNPEVDQQTRFGEMLKGCDAYIATGSNNSARYFDYYFSKYPHIIRRNRTSVAILDGTETDAQLESLADDVNLYFGLGCRNVTKLYVPKDYNFIPLLAAFKKYESFAEHHKYRNNYDYQLAILLLNNQYYMTNGSILLVENPSVFSAISQLHYEFYAGDRALLVNTLQNDTQIQCVVGNGLTEFGQAQQPRIDQFADGVDTMRFLLDDLSVAARSRTAV